MQASKYLIFLNNWIITILANDCFQHIIQIYTHADHMPLFIYRKKQNKQNIMGRKANLVLIIYHLPLLRKK